MVSLTETLAALSLVTDLGSGFPLEKGLRTCVAAVAVGEVVGLAPPELADVFQGALLAALGCTAYAPEKARLFDDDRAFGRWAHSSDATDPAALAAFGAWAGAARAGQLRDRFLAVAATEGPASLHAQCEAAAALGTRLGLRPGALAMLDYVHERWDGHGLPSGVAGEAVPLASRVAHVAEQAVIATIAGEPADGIAVISARSGGQLDPGICRAVLGDPSLLLDALACADPLAAALSVEPPPKARVAADQTQTVAEALADLADLKSCFTLGHSRGVAALADRAAELAGVADAPRARLHLAALVHDVGRAGVSSAIWERPGPLSAGEVDQVRLHAYWSERVLARSPAFSELAPIAGSHHERLDGSGYHRGASAAALPRESRILAAADVFHALREPRPHRPAADLDAACRAMGDEVGAGRLDAEAVAAVIEAAGGERPRIAWPADLTDREVEVLRLAARGLANKEVAIELGISARTVGHHLAHIYDKTGRRTRAGAGLFAMEHGLLELGRRDGA